MNKKASSIPLSHEFGQRVFDPKTNRWVKPEEAEKVQVQSQEKSQPAVRLEQLEKQISQNFLEAAEALREIKDNKLYLQVAETWEQYCKERLGRGIEAVRRQLKALEISEKSSIGAEHALEIKGLRKVARMSAQSIPSNSQSRKSAIDLEGEFRKPMPQTQTQSKPEEEDLLDEIITRIKRARNNQGFLKALKEWLDESDI